MSLVPQRPKAPSWPRAGDEIPPGPDSSRPAAPAIPLAPRAPSAAELLHGMGSGDVHGDAVVEASTEMVELPAAWGGPPTFPANEPGVPLADLVAEMVATAKTVADASAVLIVSDDERAAYRARIQELLEAGNRQLAAERAARRETAEARFEADVWRRKALEAQATIRRLMPTEGE